MNPTITIYLEAFDVNDSEINWIGFCESFESIIYHELLHACGDSPELRNEIHDGFDLKLWTILYLSFVIE